MIELNKTFESDDEAVIYFARVIGNYCLKVGKCKNCVFGLDMGDGVKNACFFIGGRLPCTWDLLMKCCGIIKREDEKEKNNGT